MDFLKRLKSRLSSTPRHYRNLKRRFSLKRLRSRREKKVPQSDKTMGEKRGLKALEAWCRRVTDGYKDVRVADMTSSWRDGLAFCALIHHFRPDLIDFDSLSKENILQNNRLAFSVAEKSLGIPALLDAEDMVKYQEPDRLSIATYLSQFYQYFEGGENKRLGISPSRNLGKRSVNGEKGSDKIFTGPPAKVAGVTPSTTVGRRHELCHVCNHRVFILERLMVDNQLYHRTCFKCCKCDALLKPGAYVEGDRPDTYECAVCPKDEKKTPEPAISSSAIDFERDLDQQKPVINVTPVPLPRTKFAPFSSERHSLKIASSATQQRRDFLRSLSSDTLPSPTNGEQDGVSSHASSPLLHVPTTTISEDSNDQNAKTAASSDVRQLSRSGSVPSSSISARKNALHKLNLSSSFNAHRIGQRSENSQGKSPLASEEGSTSYIIKKIEIPSAFLSKSTSALANDKAAEGDGPSKSHTFLKSALPKELKPLSIEDDVEPKESGERVPTHDLSSDMPKPSPEGRETKADRTEFSIIGQKSPSRVSKWSVPLIQAPTFQLSSLRSASSSPSVNTDSSRISSTSTTNFSALKLSPFAVGNKKIETSDPVEDGQNADLGVEDSIVVGDVPSETKDASRIEISHTVESRNEETVKAPALPTDSVSTDAESDTAESRNDEKMELPAPPTESSTMEAVSEGNPFDDDDEEAAGDCSVSAKSEEMQSSQVVNPTESEPIPEVSITESQNNNTEENKAELEQTEDLKIAEESKVIKEKETAENKDPDYPDDLNPFADEEEETVEETSEKIKKEYPDALNPFGDDEEEDVVQAVPTPPLSSSTPTTARKPRIDDYDASLNPFGSSDDEDYQNESMGLSLQSDISKTDEDKLSISSSKVPIRRRKKRPPPPPPPPTHSPQSQQLASTKQELRVDHSPARLTPSPRLHKKKPAPKPPVPPVPDSSLECDSFQDSGVNSEASSLAGDIAGSTDNAKAAKELNNKRIASLEADADVTVVKESSQAVINTTTTTTAWKKKKRPAPPVPIPQKRAIKKIPLKEIMSEMEEIEEKQQELEKQGIELEMAIRDRNEDEPTLEEEELIMQLFELVNQKNALFRRQAELMYLKRSQRLEEEQAELEYKIRCLMTKPASQKTPEDAQMEEELVQRLVDVVEQRNEIVESIEMDRKRKIVDDMMVKASPMTPKMEEIEDLSIHHHMSQKHTQMYGKQGLADQAQEKTKTLKKEKKGSKKKDGEAEAENKKSKKNKKIKGWF